jgi:hypothetical protein
MQSLFFKISASIGIKGFLSFVKTCNKNNWFLIVDFFIFFETGMLLSATIKISFSFLDTKESQLIKALITIKTAVTNTDFVKNFLMISAFLNVNSL